MHHIANQLIKLWERVNEPRTISVLYFVQYVVLAAAGLWALAVPPMSLEGEIGTVAMNSLAGILVFSGALGAVAALPGIYWLERAAVLGVGWAALIYLWIIVSLHFTTDGNRMLQAAFVAIGLLHQGVRWVRIHERPYRPVDEIA